MINKKILNPDRLRRINVGFSYIPHRFLTDGFLSSLSQKELLFYLFLVLVSGIAMGYLFIPVTPSALCSNSPLGNILKPERALWKRS